MIDAVAIELPTFCFAIPGHLNTKNSKIDTTEAYQPFQDPLSLVLLQIFITLLTFPIPTVAKQQTTPAPFIKLMITGESTEIFLTTLLRLKSKLIVTQFTRTTASQALTIVRTTLHSKVSTSLAYESQRKIFTSQRA